MKHNWKITFYWDVHPGGVWETKEYSEIAKNATLDEALHQAAGVWAEDSKLVKSLTIERM